MGSKLSTKRQERKRGDGGVKVVLERREAGKVKQPAERDGHLDRS